ncbi:MAG: peptidylprolyl isomerase [Rubricoccaceae bacterium]
MRVLLSVLSLFLVPSMASATGYNTGATPDTIRVEMTTEYGAITLEVYDEAAPLTVANFLRYVDGGHFDGATFYRTVRYATDNGSPQIEVIQGGRGGQDAVFEPIAHESTDQTGILHTDGVISMARGGIGTASSEFFICIGDQPGLDSGQPRNADEQGFAAFGRVVSGMEVVRAIHSLPSDAPTDSDYTRGQVIEDPAVIETVTRATED